MANTLRSQGLFKGVRLLYVREKDIGKLRAMVGLNLLDGEGEGVKQTVKENDAGLRGEFRADPRRLKASTPSPDCGVWTIINGRIEVLLKGLRTVSEAQRWEILHVHLDTLPGGQHSVALGLLPRSGAAFLHQARSLQHPVGTKDAEAVALLGKIVARRRGP